VSKRRSSKRKELFCRPKHATPSSKKFPKPIRMVDEVVDVVHNAGLGRKVARVRSMGVVKVERVPLSAQLQAVHHPVRRCLPPRKIFVWRDEQQIKIQRRFNLDSVFAVRALPR